jgi:two-component system chemotaxis sensor kinase CheA
MDPMEAIKATFFLECEEGLSELESGLMAMQDGDTDSETVNAVFRAVHSIKGGAGAFSLTRLVQFAHVFETTLDALRAGRIPPAPATLEIMLRAADALADLVRGSRDGNTVDEARLQGLAAELGALLAPGGTPPGGAPPGGTPPGSTQAAPAQPVAAPAAAENADIDDFDFEPVQVVMEPEPGPRRWRIRFKPYAELYAKGNEAGLLLRELGRLGEMTVELDLAGLPGLAELDPEAAYLSWNIELAADCDEAAIQDVFDFVLDECTLEIGAGANRRLRPTLRQRPSPRTPPRRSVRRSASISTGWTG